MTKGMGGSDWAHRSHLPFPAGGGRGSPPGYTWNESGEGEGGCWVVDGGAGGVEDGFPRARAPHQYGVRGSLRPRDLVQGGGEGKELMLNFEFRVLPPPRH